MATERKRFILISDRVKHNAMTAVMAARPGDTVTVAPPTRSGDQNSMFHAICGDIAKSGREWAGEKRDLAAWKVLLVSAHTKATDGEVEIVPGLEGEFVNIRESTARMSVSRAASLITYALAFCDTNGIPLTETRKQGFLDAEARAA